MKLPEHLTKVLKDYFIDVNRFTHIADLSQDDYKLYVVVDRETCR